MPYTVAGLTAVGWVLAGLIWGVVWPLLAGTFELETALRSIFGITVLAGSVATAFSFFAVEYCWRDTLPIFFPRGDLSEVPDAPRLPVRTRLLGIFLLISIIPLAVLGVLAYTRALALVGVAPATAAVVVDDLRLLIFFVLAAGILAAVGLAMFATHSVADPLGQVRDAMAAVGRGELDGALSRRRQRRDRVGRRGLQPHAGRPARARGHPRDVRQVRHAGGAGRDPRGPAPASTASSRR